MSFRPLTRALGMALFLGACGGSTEQISVVRLVDEFPSAEVSGTVVSTTPPEPTEWRFEEGVDPVWKAGPGVSGLRVEDNLLLARSATPIPIVHVERTSGLDDADVLHQIVVRARVSEGSNLSLDVIAAEQTVGETVELVDMAPTILDLVGLEIPEKMQGDSLVPLLSSSGESRWSSKPAVSEWTRRTDQRDRSSVDARSIIVDGYKLIHNVERPDGVPEYELYHHAEDPLDQNDIAAEHPEIVERLAKQLDDWHKWATANALPTDEESTEGLDAEELERLRSLGYVQ